MNDSNHKCRLFRMWLHSPQKSDFSRKQCFSNHCHMLGPKAFCKLTVSYFYRSTLPTCKRKMSKLINWCFHVLQRAQCKNTHLLYQQRETEREIFCLYFYQNTTHTYKKTHSAPICYINSFDQLSSLELSYLWRRNSEMIPGVSNFYVILFP